MGYADPKEVRAEGVQVKEQEVDRNVLVDRRINLEAAFYGVVLVGLLSRHFYVSKLYSDYFSQSETLSGMLRGNDSVADGWLFKDQSVDLTDEVWRRPHNMILSGLPIWLLAAALLKRVMRTSFPKYESKVLTLFYIAYACYYHSGAKVFLPLFIAGGNYFLVKNTAGTKFGTFFVWVYNLSWFFFAKQEPFVMWMIQLFQAPMWGVGNLPLKSPLRYMVLKNISYGMDYHWTKSKKMVKSDTCKPTLKNSYKERVNTHLPLDYYTDLWTYLQYHFYPALYVDGPIITFNDFILQNKTFSEQKVKYKQLLWKGFRVVAGFFIVETLLHFIYTDAIVKSGFFKHVMRASSQSSTEPEIPLREGTAILSLFTTGFLIYYSKCLVKWRWGHFWSLVDGIEPPDDFPNCIACSRTMGEFWRNWHASINKWCTRYIYIPVGGSKSSAAKQCFSVFMVFLFTAVWHTINLHFALWGALLIGFIIGEMVIKWMPRKLRCLQKPKLVQNTVRPAKMKRQMGTWTQTLKDIGGTLAVLGFIFINMGAFLFGYDCIWNLVKLFFTDIQLSMMLLVGVYANQRLVSIYHLKKQAGRNIKIHLN